MNLTAKLTLVLFIAAILLSSTAHAWTAFIAPDQHREHQVLAELSKQTSLLQPSAKLDIKLVPIIYASENSISSQIKKQLSGDIPELIVAASAAIALAAKESYPTIPLIFASQQDPIAIGLVDRLDARKTKATGLTAFLPVHRKQLQLLQALNPKMKSVGIIADRGWHETPLLYEDILSFAKQVNLKPELFLVERNESIQTLFSTKRAKQMDAWFVPATPATVERTKEVVSLINNLGKPAIYGLTTFAEHGGLVAYQAKLDPPTKILAQMIVSVMAGVAVESIPIDRPRHFELSLNMKTLRAQSLTVPLQIRDQVTKTFN